MISLLRRRHREATDGNFLVKQRDELAPELRDYVKHAERLGNCGQTAVITVSRTKKPSAKAVAQVKRRFSSSASAKLWAFGQREVHKYRVAQVAMNARCAPQRVGRCHIGDQSSKSREKWSDDRRRRVVSADAIADGVNRGAIA
jgi:hypothetical protein